MRKQTMRLLALALVLVLSLSACTTGESGDPTEASGSQEPASQQESQPGEPGAEGGLSFNAGTYEGEADGFGGKLKLEVTVSDTAIESVTVTEHTETQGIGTTAIDQIPGTIVSRQSLAVDTISGCTYTSEAVLAASANALEQSGVDMDMLYQAVSQDDGDKTVVELSTQVLVIGGGGSGLSAAISAADQGAQVVLLEKMPFLGGAASISGGQVNSGGSEYQKNHGVTNDSPETVAADLLAGGHNLNDTMVVNLYANAVGPTFDWMVEEVGVAFEPDIVSAPEHSVDRIFIGDGKAAGINDSMLSKLDTTSTDVRLNTRATELIVEDGRVVGALAEDTQGNLYQVRADVVVLATGGFGYNKDLLPDSLKDVLYYGPVSSTGDGLIMAMELGADTQLLEYGKIYPNGLEIEPGIARSTVTASTTVFNQTGTILVDRTGSRVVNETGPYAGIREIMMEQDDQTLFLVMDQEAFDLFREKCKENKYATDEELDGWLANNGSQAPVFANSADLAEAAKAAGVDAEALAATVAAFNQDAASGTDTTFGRTIAKEIGEGPYYLVEQKPRFATTLGGVKITENMEIIDEEGNPIPGVLAAGELIGGLHGDDSMPSVCVSWAFVSGRLAGLQAAEMVLGDAADAGEAEVEADAPEAETAESETAPETEAEAEAEAEAETDAEQAA